MLGMIAGIGVARLNDVPAWWMQAQEVMGDESTIRLQAQQLENAVTTQLTAIRNQDDPRWSIAITPDQANAWLDARLVDTIVTHMGDEAWPRTIERVLLGVEADQMILGVRARHQQGSVILWAHVTLELDAQGVLWAKLTSTHAGRAWVPMGVVSAFDNQQRSWARFKIGSSALELGDGRTARLLALRVNDGRIELVLETTAGTIDDPDMQD